MAWRRLRPSRQRKTFASFLLNTLAPDFRESGREATAEDLEECAAIINQGRHSKSKASYFRMVGRDYRTSGATETAKDYFRCARYVDPD